MQDWDRPVPVPPLLFIPTDLRSEVLQWAQALRLSRVLLQCFWCVTLDRPGGPASCTSLSHWWWYCLFDQTLAPFTSLRKRPPVSGGLEGLWAGRKILGSSLFLTQPSSQQQQHHKQAAGAPAHLEVSTSSSFSPSQGKYAFGRGWRIEEPSPNLYVLIGKRRQNTPPPKVFFHRCN